MIGNINFVCSRHLVVKRGDCIGKWQKSLLGKSCGQTCHILLSNPAVENRDGRASLKGSNNLLPISPESRTIRSSSFASCNLLCKSISHYIPSSCLAICFFFVGNTIMPVIIIFHERDAFAFNSISYNQLWLVVPHS